MNEQRVIEDLAWLTVFVPKRLAWQAMHERYGMERWELIHLVSTQAFRDALREATYFYIVIPKASELVRRRLERAIGGDPGCQRQVFEAYFGEGSSGITLEQNRISGLDGVSLKEILLEGIRDGVEPRSIESGSGPESSGHIDRARDRLVDEGGDGGGSSRSECGGGAGLERDSEGCDAEVSGVEFRSSLEAAVGESESVQDHDVHRRKPERQDDVVDQ